MTRLFGLSSIGIVLAHTLSATAARPTPIGEADITFSYMTDSGLFVRQGSVDYSGTSANDVVPLGGDPRFGYFNSVNSFGRRPLVPGAIRENESLLAHSVFKPSDDRSVDFFEGIIAEGSVTLEVQNIHFDEPVWVQQDTVLLQKLWDADQTDQLPNFYVNLHNQDSATDPFRDFDDFFPLVFNNFPQPNYELGVLTGPNSLEVFGDGTDTLGFRITIPYSRFRHFEDVDQIVPPGLPAPFGFLEPFHFHVEFVVSDVPEPATALILLVGVPLVVPRRRR